MSQVQIQIEEMVTAIFHARQTEEQRSQPRRIRLRRTSCLLFRLKTLNMRNSFKFATARGNLDTWESMELRGPT
jgi:hypothetical protein